MKNAKKERIIKNYKHNSYRQLSSEFYNLFPELVTHVIQVDKHDWSNTSRGVVIHMDNGIKVLFQILNIKFNETDPAWSSFRAILVPSNAEL